MIQLSVSSRPLLLVLFVITLSTTKSGVSAFLPRTTASSSSCSTYNQHSQTTSSFAMSMSLGSAATASATDSTPSYSTIEIIGGGRIGSLLAQHAGDKARVLGRNDSIDPNGDGPILIATRNDALAGIVEACPAHRRDSLVFLQNGYLDGFLEQYNLQQNTQALLFFSVTGKGVPPVDGITTVNPEGLTTVTSSETKWSAAVAQLIQNAGLKCVVATDPADYNARMYEKLIWIATMMLVGTAQGSATVGQADAEHPQVVAQVVEELKAAVEQHEQGAVTFAPGTLERLRAYTAVVADFPCGVKEFEWRNQFFYNLRDGQSNNDVELCPIHNQLLRDCQAAGALAFELP